LLTEQLDTVVLLLVELIGSVVISLTRCCLPNDEGPGPPNIFFPEPPLSRTIVEEQDQGQHHCMAYLHTLRRIRWGSLPHSRRRRVSGAVSTPASLIADSAWLHGTHAQHSGDLVAETTINYIVYKQSCVLYNITVCQLCGLRPWSHDKLCLKSAVIILYHG